MNVYSFFVLSNNLPIYHFTDIIFSFLVGERSHKLLHQPGVIDWTKMYKIYGMCMHVYTIIMHVFQRCYTSFTAIKECIAEYLMNSLCNPMKKEYGCLYSHVLVEKFALTNPISHQHR